jgi:hypothetical protein
MERMKLAQDRPRWLVHVNTVKKIQEKRKEFLEKLSLIC